MNRVSVMLVVALFAVQPAFANQDVESELAEMRELVEGLKEKVDAQEEQLSHQGDLLEQAQDRIQSDEGSKSGLSSFVDSLVVTGHVAGSYAYNLDDPAYRYGQAFAGGADVQPNSGRVGNFLPFHPDHNTFVVDQVWFGLGKPATAESRGGFQFDVLFGNTANFLGQGTTALGLNGFGPSPGDGRRTGASDSTSDYYIAQAFIEYQAPCEACGDVNFKFGKFQTYVGSEVVQANQNYNVTRGIVYSLLQPVDHLGITATSNLGPVELTLGLLNSGSSSISSPDNNFEKTYMASAAVGDDRLNGRATFLYGAEGNANNGSPGSNLHPLSNRLGLVDVVLNFNPADNLGLWANSTYVYAEGSSLRAWGVALAGRLGITDDLGIAARAEYAQDSPAEGGSGITGDGFGLGSGPPGNSTFLAGQNGSKVYSVTGTVDYALASNLTLKGEVRWDRVNEEGNEEFGLFGSGEEDQTVLLVEGVYSF